VSGEWCICEPGEGCDEEGQPGCAFCCALDGEMPCPADPATWDGAVEGLMDDVQSAGFEAVVVCADGSEPFASLDCGHGLVLDLTAHLRRAEARQ
jgi:hypothetical protein